MIIESTISGAKGGSSSFKQRADTLRSNDTFEGLLVLCGGPIVGPVNGLKSQKINGTPIEDASGTANFKDVVMLTADGDPAKFPQIATLKLGAGASPLPVNLSVGNTNPAGTPGPWVVKTMANTGADSIDLRFIVNQLYRQDKTGIFEAVANLEIQLKPIGFTNWINPNLGTPAGTYQANGTPITGRSGSQLTAYLFASYFNGAGGTWTPEANSGYLAISGKTTSAYVHELRIDVPNTGVYFNKGWDIRVRLREVESLDADPNYEKRMLQWESVAAVYASDVGDHEDWRGVAWAQIFGKASDQFNGAPEIEGDFYTKIVSVPPVGVFNPSTRQYTATTWDGSFSKAYTNDPAWVINDALSDGIFGLSNLAPGAHLNKWDALEVSKYCSQLVSDGAAGTHPRFSLNLKVTEPQKADEFIQYLAGAVSGFAWDDGSGEWRMKIDKPETPSDIITLETIESEFSYAHSDIDTRYNDITMTFLNEEMDFREDRVRVYDQDHIDIYGRKPTSVVAVGCTNRQECIRRATLRLRASINEFRMVNYIINRRGRLVQPFDTVLIADGDLGYKLPTPLTLANPTDVDATNNRTTGRVLSMNGARTILTLRDSIRMEVGVTYLVHFSIPNPDYNPEPTTQPLLANWSKPTVTISRTITNTSVQRGDVKTLYLNTALPATIPEYANFALEAAGLPSIPKTYRILEVKPDEDGERVAVTAMEVDTGKYAAADAAVATAFSYAAPPFKVPTPLAPTSGALISLVQIPGDALARVNLVVNWQRPASLYLNGFDIRYRVNNGPYIDAVAGVQDTSWEMVDPAAGTYEFEIRCKDRRGAVSLPLTGSLVVNAAAIAALGALQNANVLSVLEKTSIVLPKHTEREDRYAQLSARAGALGITTALTLSASMRANWLAYLGTLSPAWNLVTVPTTIVRTTFKANDDAYDAALNGLDKVISEEDAKRSTWALTGNRPPLLTGANLTVDETFKDPTAWSSTQVSFLTDATGEGYIEQTGTPTGVITHLPLYSAPIDLNATYEASFDLFQTGAGAGTALFYTVIQLYDAAGVNIAGDGSYWYYPTAAAPVTTRGVWETNSARFGRGTDRPFPANAVRFSIGLIMNYTNLNVTTRARRCFARRISTLEMTSTAPQIWAFGDGKAIRNAGVTSWGQYPAHSRAPIKGPQRLSWRWVGPNATGTAKMVGITEVSVPTSYSSAALAIYYTDTADRIDIVDNTGGPGAVYTGITTRNSDEFAIEYDGLNLIPLRNGVAMGYKAYVGPDKTYRGMVDSYYPGQGATQVSHGSTSSLAIIGGNTVDINGNPVPLDALRNNLVDTGWWRRSATIPWASTGGGGARTMVSTPFDVVIDGFKANPEDSMRVTKTGASGATIGGGWSDGPASRVVGVDPDKPYRFVLPVRHVSGDSSLYWGIDGSSVCDINTTTPDTNPYFVAAGAGILQTDRWYVFVGFIYPRNSTGKYNDSAGIYDCRTGKRIVSGENFCFLPAFNGVNHRAFQYYGVADSAALFGKPIVNVVDGTEPELSTFFEATSSLEDVSLDWITTAGHIAKGNTIGKALGTSSAWDGKAVTKQSYKSNAFISGRLETPDTFIGFHELGDSNASYISLLHSVHRSGDGNWYYWSGSAAVLNMGTSRNGVTFDNLTDWALFYDNTTVKIFADGVFMHDVTATPDKSFQGGVVAYSSVKTVSNVRFGPFTENTVVTALPPADLVINATSAGAVIAGQFNKVMTPTVKRGGVDFRTNNRMTYTVTNITSGLTGFVTVDNTNGSAGKGQVTITGITATGTFKLNVLYDGVILNTFLCEVKIVPAPTALGGGGGGGTKSGSVAIGGIDMTDTTLIELGRISGLVKAAGETVRCTLAAGSFIHAAGGTFSSRNLSGKFQISVAGANSWSDVGAVVTSTNPSDWDPEVFYSSQGYLTISQNTAPSNNTYDIRFVCAEATVGTGATSFDIGVTVSVVIGV